MRDFIKPATAKTTRLLLRSRVVLPVSKPPIDDGAVLISGNRIRRVGHWKDLAPTRSVQTIDLGESVLLPGLVNAHCHLDYTGMAGMVPPQRSFTDWIKLITTAKAEWNYSEFAESWLLGAGMLVRSGTTTVADFEVIPELLPDVWSATPLRVLSFLELTGVRSRRDPRLIVSEALACIDALPRGRCQAAVAPHAPYSTVPALVKLAATAARRRKWPLSIHVAESSQEFEMFKRGRGEMFDWLRRNERDMTDCGSGSPVRHLDRQRALGPNLLAIHVNCLDRGDAKLLAKRNVSVVHCPRSHFYFRHDKFPFQQLVAAKVNVCLGTDSLVTVYRRRRESVELSLFDEMRAFAGVHHDVSPEQILKMATVNGARALRMQGRIGEIAPLALADLIAIPFSGNAADAAQAVVHHHGDVAASMIGGVWAIRLEQ